MSLVSEYLEKLENKTTTLEKLARLKYTCKIHKDLTRLLAISKAIEIYKYNLHHGKYD